jgi:hypothetical protein
LVSSTQESNGGANFPEGIRPPNPHDGLDLSFDPGSGVTGPVNAIVLQPDGKVIIGGQFTTVKGRVRTNIARLDPDGTGDPTFSNQFRRSPPSSRDDPSPYG